MIKPPHLYRCRAADAANGQELWENPDASWNASERRIHPTKNWWLHAIGNRVIVIDLALSDRELAFRRGKASFKPFAAIEAYKAAKDAYSKAFWKGRFALHLPNEGAHSDEFKGECKDPPT